MIDTTNPGNVTECGACDRLTRRESLVGGVCPDCRDLAERDELRAENDRLRAALIHRCAVRHVEAGCPECRAIGALLDGRRVTGGE